MITIETQTYDTISQHLYDSIIASLDLSCLSCSCGHTGSFIWYGSYNRKVILSDRVVLLRISRVLCRNCGCTHAVLLSSIVPYSQIPLKIHVAVACCCENRNTLSSILCGQVLLDENNIASLLRSFRICWEKRFYRCSIHSMSISHLIRHCFQAFSQQFMQMKSTKNVFFRLPT